MIVVSKPAARLGLEVEFLPGDWRHGADPEAIEKRLRAYMRWNAMALVVRANRLHPHDGGDLGGHIASFQSDSTLYETGFNHFWHAESENHGGDCIYFQGHSAPGIYARAYLEGRITVGLVTPYPPGIPLLIPGEVFNKKIVDYLKFSREFSKLCPGFETDIHGLVKGEDGRYHVDCVKD